ncbi:peptidylprolyl isomerase [Clostridia bacterium OttesenSCG-928-F22]|nr:peptidylprolyl isomerase [Clostridia bacterium OttesenSCG-928-F22]
MKGKRLMAILMACIMLAGALSGCALATVDAGRDGAQVVATVNGEEITKLQLNHFIEEWRVANSSQASAFDFNPQTQQGKNTLKNLRLALLRQLCMQRALLQKADELGVAVLNDEQEQEIESTYQQMLDGNIEWHRAKYTNRTTNDPDFDPTSYAYQDFIEEIAAEGYTLEMFREAYVEAKRLELIKEYVENAVEVTDEQLKARYDAYVVAQQLKYDAPDEIDNDYRVKLGDAYTAAEISDEEPDFSSDILSDTIPVTYYPARKYVQVKHILIPFETADKTAMTELATSGSENTTEEEAAEINRKFEELMEESYGRIQAKTDEVLQKAKNGEDFDALIEEYSTDTGQTNYLEKGGYVVGDDGTYEQGFVDEALKFTEAGQISGLAKTTNGYHILLCTKIFPQGETVEFSAVSEKLKELMLTQQKETAWLNAQNEWYNEEEDVVFYTDRIM